MSGAWLVAELRLRGVVLVTRSSSDVAVIGDESNNCPAACGLVIKFLAAGPPGCKWWTVSLLAAGE